jgi:hypothetical protein
VYIYVAYYHYMDHHLMLRPTRHFVAVAAVMVLGTTNVDQFHLGWVPRKQQRPVVDVVVAVPDASVAAAAPPRAFRLVQSNS